MNLNEIIIQKIEDDGPMCFQQFMEICLYYPELGYYTSPGIKIGKNGDFYTSAFLTPIFGTLIGKQLEEMWNLLGVTDFTIVEYGAGTGILCRDILSYLECNEKIYNHLKYCIIEKSPVMREIERECLPEKVEWYNSIEEITMFNGCVLSNELIDNFSVHQVIMENELMEVYIIYREGHFSEILQPASRELKQYLKELKIELPKGFRTEINMQALKWIREIASTLNQGYVMTIDYGYLSSELYTSSRSQGTLLCYNNHAVNSDPYMCIGEQDITSHVNFSALINYGKKCGLSVCGFTDQCRFLLAMGFQKLIQQAFSNEKDIVRAAREASILSHTLLIDMGRKFKVLIQQKGMNSKRLTGLEMAMPFN